MKYPSKAVPFEKSTFSYFVPILKALNGHQYTPLTLYTKIPINKRPTTDEYIDSLLCLYALGKIDLNEELGVLYRVN